MNETQNLETFMENTMNEIQNLETFMENVLNGIAIPKWQQQHLLEILEKPKRNPRLIKAGKRRGQMFGANPSYIIIDTL